MGAYLHRLFARIKAVFQKRELDEDFEMELQYHLDMLVDDYKAKGMSETEALRQAKIKMEGMEQVKETHREARGLVWLDQLCLDIKYSLRVLKKERQFTFTVLIITALGIGLNTTVFSIVNTTLLKPLPFTNAEQLVWIENGNPDNPNRGLSNIASKVDTWEGLEETSQSIQDFEAYMPFLYNTHRLTELGEPESVVALMVSPGLFPMLGLKPLHGRLIADTDAQTGSESVIVLSHEIWQRRFGSDPDIVGKTVRMNNNPSTVVGVMPANDAFVSSLYPTTRIDMYIPLVKDTIRNRGNTVLIVGRMKPGMTIEETEADLQVSIGQLKQQYPERGEYYQAHGKLLDDKVKGGLRTPLLFLWLAALALLCIVGFNLGGLLLARGSARRGEFALRSALGASNIRLLKQMLTECSLLIGTGSILGVALAWSFINFLSTRSSIEIPLLKTVSLDGSALGFTLIICISTSILCGLAPAWRWSFGRSHEFQSLKEDGGRTTQGKSMARSRSTLVVLEVALACSLAIVAALMVRSLNNVLDIDLGIDPENLIAVRIDPLAENHDEMVQAIELILDRVRAMPGVTAAGMTDCIPVERDRSWGISKVSDPSVDERSDYSGAHVRIVTPGLIGSMGIQFMNGRDFTRFDGNNDSGNVIINTTLAKKYWPDENAVGKHMSHNGNPPIEIIGVVENVRHSGPEVDSGNEMYFPMRFIRGSSWDMMVRTTEPINQFTGGLRLVLKEIDPNLPVTTVREMSSIMDRTVSSRKLISNLLAGFAALSILLAGIGLYGVIAYGVAQRTKEIGIRLALGAKTGRVRYDVFIQTFQLAVTGVVIGLVSSYFTGRFLQSILYDISSFDPVTIVVMVTLVLGCATGAGYIPAHRASKVDPLKALKSE